ncbi:MULTISPECIES: hypothetical protein [unclassified Mesorhizobium]|uniref:hypothetical protein n=1 Tax=unclassified Mesorhizobium TaxID=325217 RepID=UPI001129AFA7|nr:MULTISPECIES: hypothetical protein [unclassified Mesorhizobium]TPJ70496.1 hypothetical protein FJ462_07325 [Mesorhizobium sp. B2-6-7]TPJ76847.1 hypothetical protein FJ422_29495 [Mesorhizobium sp. B2-6-3]
MTESTAPLKPEALDPNGMAAARQKGRDIAGNQPGALVEAFAETAAAGAVAYLEASRATQEQGVKVKALEWRHLTDGRYATGHKPGQLTADIYTIADRHGAFYIDDARFTFMRQRFASMEEAKAAAQADYEARIRGALSTQEPASEPVAWAGVVGDSVAFLCRAGTGKEELARLADDYKANIIPLFTHPPAPAVPSDLVERLVDAIPGTFEPDGDGYYDTPPTILLREAASAIASLIARVAEVERERDDIISLGQSVSTTERERADRAEAALAGALKIIKPFAEAARRYGTRYLEQREALRQRDPNLPHNYAQAVLASAEQTGWNVWADAIAILDATLKSQRPEQ